MIAIRKQILALAASLVALTNPTAAFRLPHDSYCAINQRVNHALPSEQRVASSTQLQLTHTELISNVDIVSSLPSLEVTSSLLSTENIKTAFSVATFLPQVFWLFLILIVSLSVCIMPNLFKYL